MYILHDNLLLAVGVAMAKKGKNSASASPRAKGPKEECQNDDNPSDEYLKYLDHEFRTIWTMDDFSAKRGYLSRDKPEVRGKTGSELRVFFVSDFLDLITCNCSLALA